LVKLLGQLVKEYYSTLQEAKDQNTQVDAEGGAVMTLSNYYNYD
jgi:hypothetical protein